LPDASVAGRLTVPLDLSRGTGDDAEQGILSLLRLRFTDPNDLELHRRQQRLAELFAQVPQSRAAALRDRLGRPRRSDELSQLFWKLSTPSREQMLAILDRKRRRHQRTVRAQQSVRNDPHYIDNAFKAMTLGPNDEVQLWLVPPSTLTRSAGGQEDFRDPASARGRASQTRVIVVPKMDVYRGTAPHLFNHNTVFPDRRSALAEFVAPVAAAQQRGPGTTIVVACYRGPKGVVLPTLYTRVSTPRVIATLGELEGAVRRRELEKERRFRADTDALASMFRVFYDTFNFLPIELDEHGNPSISSDPTSWLGAAKLARSGVPPKPGGGVMRLLARGGRAARGTAREAGRRIYRQLARAGHSTEGSARVIRPSRKSYPTVEVRPNGDVFGNWDDLNRYLADAGLTGSRKGGATTLEAHHLVEDRLVKPYGISHGEGWCVALEAVEHAEISRELPRWLPQNVSVYDIDHIVLASERMYRDLGYSEFVPHVRAFVRQHRQTIRGLYTQRRVPGASQPDFNARLRRVLKFVDAL
jgi:hypothetical protein